MIGEETANEAVALIYTAIGELAEDVAGEAILLLGPDAEAWTDRAMRLRAVGQDIVVLTLAMGVLLSRSRDL